jgi:hypothetical protein
MSKAGRKTRRKRQAKAASGQPSLTVIDFIYRRLTGDTTGKAPIGKAGNAARPSR